MVGKLPKIELAATALLPRLAVLNIRLAWSGPTHEAGDA